MVVFRWSALALLVSNASAKTSPLEDEAKGKLPDSTPNINVNISASFPQSEVFGVKLVNGLKTVSLVSVKNGETFPVRLSLISGALTTPQGKPGTPSPPAVLRNLTSQKYGSSIPAGSSESFSYTFANDMHPQEVGLALTAHLEDDKGALFALQFHDQNVSVIEAPSSFFDPQIMFLYLLLLAGLAGTSYFIYQTWVTTLFPQKKGRGKGGERAKRSSGGSKKVDPTEQVAVVGADGPAVTSSAKFDQSWIPAHHLNRPEAKRVGSGSRGPRPKTSKPLPAQATT